MVLRYSRSFLVILAVASALAAQDNQYTLVARPKALDLNSATSQGVLRKNVWFDYDNAVLQQTYVLDLIKNTTGQCITETKGDPFATRLRPCTASDQPVFPGKNDYIIFHVLNWSSTPGSGLAVSKQNWYIYNSDPNWDHTAFAGTRIFGKKSVYLFTIHLNLPSDVRYEERYAVDEKHKTPAFLDHFVGVAQLFLPEPGGKGDETSPDLWYAFRLNVKYVPSDLQITPTIVPYAATATVAPATPPVTPPAASPATPNGSLGPPPETVPVPGTPKPAQPPTPPVTNPTPAQPSPAPPVTAPPTPAAPSAKPATAGTTPVTLDAKTFDNEGKYHIDFSVAVPIIKISELSFTQASNTIVPAKIEKQKLFALFNYYPVAVDVKNTIFPKYPYLLTGVAIGSQPLKKALFGIGWGPIYTNFYAGLLLNTQHVPSTFECGDKTPGPAPVGTKLENRTCPEFNFGLNVGIGAITDALKNKTSGKK